MYQSGSIYHYGVGKLDGAPGRGSGRYPLGSGKRPYQGGNTTYSSAETKALKKVNTILSQLQSNTGVAKEIVRADKYGSTEVGSFLNSHDQTWQEMEIRDYMDGTQGLFPPAQVIKDFMAIGKNPYSADNDTLFDITKVNPGFGEPGTTGNCTKCAATVELRQRGFNVSAGRMETGDCRSFLDWFNDCEEKIFDSFDSFEDELDSERGSSGVFAGRWGNGGAGHMLHYNVDNNGNVHVEDGQNATMYDSLSSAFEHYGFSRDDTIRKYRLDNCEPNYDNMAYDSVIRSSDSSRSVLRNRDTGKVVRRW